MKAVYNNIVIAESNECIEVEGNYYFPPESVKMEYFTKTDMHTTCPWKGEASYYTIKTDDALSENAAWYYPEPKAEAVQIKNYVAFYRNIVEVKE